MSLVVYARWQTRCIAPLAGLAGLCGSALAAGPPEALSARPAPVGRLATTQVGPRAPEEAVVDIRIEGDRRTVRVHAAAEATVGRASSTSSDAWQAGVGARWDPESVGVLDIRIVGTQESAAAPILAEDSASLPAPYDASQDPYQQYPELLDPGYQPPE